MTQQSTYHKGSKNYGTGYEMMTRIDALEASNKALVEALGKVLPHVNTAREATQQAANERQDTPALDAVMAAHAALAAAKKYTGGETE